MPAVVPFILNLFLRTLYIPIEEQASSENKSVWYLFFRVTDIVSCIVDVGGITICTCSLSLFCILNYPSSLCEFTGENPALWLVV